MEIDKNVYTLLSLICIFKKIVKPQNSYILLKDKMLFFHPLPMDTEVRTSHLLIVLSKSYYLIFNHKPA